MARKLVFSLPYTWNSYDAVSALISAIKKVAIVQGETLYIPRGDLAKAVRELKEFQGISGVITCRENGECNASGPVFYIVRAANGFPLSKSILNFLCLHLNGHIRDCHDGSIMATPTEEASKFHG